MLILLYYYSFLPLFLHFYILKSQLYIYIIKLIKKKYFYVYNMNIYGVNCGVNWVLNNHKWVLNMKKKVLSHY